MGGGFSFPLPSYRQQLSVSVPVSFSHLHVIMFFMLSATTAQIHASCHTNISILSWLLRSSQHSYVKNKKYAEFISIFFCYDWCKKYFYFLNGNWKNTEICKYACSLHVNWYPLSLDGSLIFWHIATYKK